MIERYNYDTSLTAKGGCYVCGSTNNLVSSGIIIEGEGLLALCGGCINDFAVTAGYKVNGQDEFERIIDQLRVAREVADHVAAERDDAQEKLSQLREQWVAAVEASA